MDKMIEVRYAGAVVARSAVVRDADPQGLFLNVTEPMPVGTELLLKVGNEAFPGKVAAVSESQEVARAGMRVQFRDSDDAALFGMALAAAPPPVPGSASAPTAVGSVGSGGTGSAPLGSGRVAAAVGRVASGGLATAAAADASGRVAAVAAPVATGSLAAEDEGEAPVEVRSSAQPSPSGSDRPPAPKEPETSGPVSSGDGGGAAGGAGAGGGPGGAGRKNRRNRRR